MANARSEALNERCGIGDANDDGASLEGSKSDLTKIFQSVEVVTLLSSPMAGILF